jgi:hypothetical protein
VPLREQTKVQALITTHGLSCRTFSGERKSKRLLRRKPGGGWSKSLTPDIITLLQQSFFYP